LTDSTDLDPVVGRFESEGRGVGKLEPVKGGVVEVDEVVAVEAHEVVVELGSGVEAGDSTGMAGLGDHAHAGQVFESAVDSCAGYAGKARLDGIENLVGRRVVVEVEDRLEDDPALHRTAFAAIAAEPPEKLDSF